MPGRNVHDGLATTAWCSVAVRGATTVSLLARQRPQKLKIYEQYFFNTSHGYARPSRVMVWVAKPNTARTGPDQFGFSALFLHNSHMPVAVVVTASRHHTTHDQLRPNRNEYSHSF